MFDNAGQEPATPTIGTMLEDVIANCEFLSDEDADQKSGL